MNTINNTAPIRRILRVAPQPQEFVRSASPAPSVTGSIDQGKTLRRYRRCWSPMITRPDLDQLPAAKAHCLNFLKGSFSTNDLSIRRSSNEEENVSLIGTQKFKPNLMLHPGKTALLTQIFWSGFD